MGKTGFGRTGAVFFSCILCAFAAEKLLPGITSEGFEQTLLTGALLGCVYAAVRPILRLVSGPIGCLTFGLSGVILDVGIIYLCARLIDGFAVQGPLWALAMALFVNVICAIAGGFGRK